MNPPFMNPTFKTICLALLAGVLAGAAAATCVLAVDAQGKIGFEFDARNGRQHLELDRPDTGDATGRPPRFWGLQVGSGDSLTAIGVYSGRTTPAARYVAPAHPVKLSPRLPE